MSAINNLPDGFPALDASDLLEPGHPEVFGIEGHLGRHDRQRRPSLGARLADTLELVVVGQDLLPLVEVLRRVHQAVVFANFVAWVELER